MSDAAPTVIVSRRVVPGREDEFRSWNGRLQAAAASFPGHVSSEAQPPSEVHPGEWIIVYRFATQPELDAWLSSDERRALMDEGADLLEGPTREQRVAVPDPATHAVTAVISQRIDPTQLPAFERAQAEIVRRMQAFPGFLRADVAEPVPGVQDDHVIVFSFSTRADLDRWLRSDTRREALRTLDPLVEGQRTINVVEGFAGWFTGSDGEPLRWKQAVAVLIALYPTTLTLGWLQRTLVPDVPWVPALFVSNVIGIALLTWVLMPRITAWLGPWLRRRPG
jgi:uncharacterized protein